VAIPQPLLDERLDTLPATAEAAHPVAAPELDASLQTRAEGK
jgi:hypothetical protein